MSRPVRRWASRILGALVVLPALAAALLYTPDMPIEALKPLYASAQSRFIDIDGATIHVRDDGRRDAPVLLLIHGSNASLQVWEPWVQHLGDSIRVVSFDLPGHGLTGPWPREDYSIAAYADVVVRLADRLDIPRFAVGGHSMGGAVAWTIASRHPERITHLILVDAAAYPRDDAAPLSLRIARMPVIGEMAAMLKPRWLVARSLREIYADPARLDPAQVQRHHDLLRRDGNRAATLKRLRMSTPLDPTPLASLKVPTLILWGAQDRWVPLDDARRLHRDIAGSTLVIHDDAGHVPMEEIPDRTAADVRQLMRK